MDNWWSRFMVMYLIVFVAIGIIGHWAIDDGAEGSRSASATKPEIVYCMNFGCVVCQDSAQGPCGIALSKCVDGKKYFCLQNVATEERQP